MKRLVLSAIVPLIASFGLALVPASSASAASATCGGTSLVQGQPVPRVAPSDTMRVPTVGNGTPNQFLCNLLPSNVAGLVPVERLQIDLNACHGANLAVDGEYGPATTQAVMNAQRAEGATPDGDYGPQTIMDGFTYQTRSGFCEKAPGAR